MFLFQTNDFDGYKVRKAREDDGIVIFQLLQKIAKQLQQKGIKQWEIYLQSTGYSDVQSGILANATYVVEDKQGQLVASFHYTDQQSDWDCALWGEKAGAAYYIHRLAVHPDYRHQEIGQRILAWIERNRQLQNTAIRLDCVHHNSVLNQFYQQAGYTFCGRKQYEGFLYSLYEKR